MKQRGPSHLQGIFDIASTIKSNFLYYGDNLTVMRDRMPDECVDLIYLDPPFNSQRNYNLIYKKLTGLPVPEQEEAFCDAWEMDAEKEDMVRNMPIAFEEYGADKDLIEFWRTWIQALKHTQPRLLAYLVYMSYRLFEMKRILKSTGSLYLHCDPTASHYIKVILDGIFGHSSFNNELIWKRSAAHGGAGSYNNIHDTILYYSKGKHPIWNSPRQPYDPKYIKSHYSNTDDGRPYQLVSAHGAGSGPARKFGDVLLEPPPGRHWMSQEHIDKMMAEGRVVFTKSGMPRYKRYLDDTDGMPLGTVWDDIPPINSQAIERLGYPTQKPIVLLERIIQASSNPGDVVFDPFAGCGSAIYAAHQLGRKWIGCDIAILSVQIVRDVLLKRYGLRDGEHYEVDGIPLSVEGADDLFKRDPHQFQHWAVELAGGFSSAKLSGDLGIDGRIHYETQVGLRNMVLSVKGGKLTPAFMRELHGVLEREPNAEMGGLICLQPPTKGMISEAASAGVYCYMGTSYDRLQIRTIEDLLEGKGFHTPSKVQTLDWVRQMRLPL